MRALQKGTQTDHGEAVAKPRRAKAERAALAGSRPAPVASRRALDPDRMITVVSGLPRSGTSMMMQMLEAGGLEIASDAKRVADADNPRGYYEYEAVKRLRTEGAFLAGIRGRAIKIVAPLLPSLPSDHDYRVVFMERDLDEILASQRKMLSRLATRPAAAEADRAGEAALKQAFARQLRQVKIWLGQRENVRTCFVAHERALADPGATAARVAEFLRNTGPAAGPAPIPEAMAGIVDPRLYRQRNPVGG